MTTAILTKTCCRCKEAKPLTAFHKDKSRKDGMTAACSPCGSTAKAAWRAANPEKSKLTDNGFRKAQPEKFKAMIDAYWAKNPGQRLAKNQAWRKNNPGARKIQDQNRRAKKQKDCGVLSKGLAAKLFKLQKGMCPCCRQPLGDDYHLDHITPLALGGPNVDGNMQLLRAICNHQKHAKHPVDFMQSRGFLL